MTNKGDTIKVSTFQPVNSGDSYFMFTFCTAVQLQSLLKLKNQAHEVTQKCIILSSSNRIMQPFQYKGTEVLL